MAVCTAGEIIDPVSNNIENIGLYLNLFSHLHTCVKLYTGLNTHKSRGIHTHNQRPRDMMQFTTVKWYLKIIISETKCRRSKTKKSNKQNKSLVWFMRFMSVQAHMFILELFYHHF